MEPTKPLPDAEGWFRPERLNLPDGVIPAPGVPGASDPGSRGLSSAVLRSQVMPLVLVQEPGLENHLAEGSLNLVSPLQGLAVSSQYWPPTCMDASFMHGARTGRLLYMW